ncbi:hypothetical protein DUNSADRAFT_927 [Dunaliella salina]|uniref:Encoded protein n=1 Tax=Dunaliella salina TaxID=3046 RepID=A0ABQ7H8R9_DUNSA|nr:hypothetical protein DUNSADRAFT_927 [Dunaliella salina]|eukprot:KAF5843251.1 hypothetical protein DUNSADRAFT_927 [Dunaliella salina]
MVAAESQNRSARGACAGRGNLQDPELLQFELGPRLVREEREGKLQEQRKPALFFQRKVAYWCQAREGSHFGAGVQHVSSGLARAAPACPSALQLCRHLCRPRDCFNDTLFKGSRLQWYAFRRNFNDTLFEGSSQTCISSGYCFQ